MNDYVECACGCGGKIEPFDKRGRSRSFINRHGRRSNVTKIILKDKRCLKCKKLKLIDQFKSFSYISKFTGKCLIRYKSECKLCIKKYTIQYKLENKEEIRKQRKEYNLEHKESNRKYKTNYSKNKRNNDPVFRLRTYVSNHIRMAMQNKGISKSNKSIRKYLSY